MDLQPLVARAVLPPSCRSALCRDTAKALFDDAAVQRRLVADFLTREGVVLRDAKAPRAAGVYALRYHGTHPWYRELDEPRVVYVGKGAYLPERLSSHRASLSEVVDLDVADFTVALLALPSLLQAEVAEHLLIGAFEPLWCRTDWRGFGSRPQGRGRSAQRPTPWDRRHPGRLARTQSAGRAHARHGGGRT